ncbi:MAG: zinc-ribbon domain-containing protein [Clostridia bacterium]|nr:zinc-ribbon domain-containing protein [Clostridia bacterium]
MEKFCTNCGAALDENSVFCTACGTRQETAEPAPEKEAPAAKANPMDTKRLIKLGIGALAFVLSFVMLILAFCPILRIVQPGDFEAEIKISPLQNIAFVFDAIQSKDYEDLQDTALYDRYEDAIEDFYDELDGNEDEYDDLSAKAKRLYNKCSVYQTRLEMRGENFGLTPAMVIAAVLSLVYVLAAVALVAISLWYLLTVLLGTAGIGDKLGSLRQSLSFLSASEESVKAYLVSAVCALPMLMISLFASMFMTFEGESFKTVIAGPGVCVIVFCAILFAGFIAEKVLAKEFKLDRALVTRGIAFVCALLLTVLAFAPVISTKIRAEFSGRSSEKTVRVGMSASILTSWYLTKEVKDDLKDSMETMEDVYDDKDDAREALLTAACPSFVSYKSRDVEDGEYDVTIGSFLLMSHVAGGYMGMGWIFGLVTVLNALVAIAGCALMWYNLVAVAGGKSVSAIAKYAKRVALIAAVIALLLTVLFAIMTTSSIKKYLDNDYEVSVGIAAGIVFMVIFAVVNFVLPAIVDKVSGLIRKPEAVEQEPVKETESVQ